MLTVRVETYSSAESCLDIGDFEISTLSSNHRTDNRPWLCSQFLNGLFRKDLETTHLRCVDGWDEDNLEGALDLLKAIIKHKYLEIIHFRCVDGWHEDTLKRSLDRSETIINQQTGNGWDEDTLEGAPDRFETIFKRKFNGNQDGIVIPKSNSTNNGWDEEAPDRVLERSKTIANRNFNGDEDCYFPRTRND